MINDRMLFIGAAFSELAMSGRKVTIHERPGLESALFDIISNENSSSVLFKYSTKKKHPWYFSITKEQLSALETRAPGLSPDRRFFALICYLDGICLVSLEDFRKVVSVRRKDVSWGLSISRPASSQYRVSGPAKNILPYTVPRTRWIKDILGD